jgi:hypothetical protein
MRKTGIFNITILASLLFLGVFGVSKALTMQEIIAGQTSGQVLGATTNGLVGYWNLDEGSGTTAADSSGNGNNGTITGATWTTGKVGSGALSFDGSNYVKTTNTTFATDTYAVFAWVKPAISTSSVMSVWGIGGYNDYGNENALAIQSNTVKMCGYNCNGVLTSSGMTIPTDAWSFIGYSRSGSTVTFFVNGATVSKAILYPNVPSSGNPFQIGATANNRTVLGYWQGLIDEVRVYNRALSNQEILDVYNDTDSSPPGDTTAPTVPAGLTATAVSSFQINLSWSASTDDVGVTGYKIFRNGSQVGTTGSTSFRDNNLTAFTNYSYTISAFDAAGNNSAQSSPATATTQGGTVTGNDIYIAQNQLGTGDGSSCANPKDAAFFNDPASWASASTAGKIGPGTTVHLCGTFNFPANDQTNGLLDIRGSGAPGAPVTILFEPNAILQSPQFSGYGGILCHSYHNCRHDVVIDGGTNGVIQNTDSGSPGNANCLIPTGPNGACGHNGYDINGNLVSTLGMFVTGWSTYGLNNIEIKNLTVRNIYLNSGANPGDNDSGGKNSGDITIADNMSNVSIHNCTFNDARVGIGGSFAGKTWSNVSIYSNIVDDHAWSMSIAGDKPQFSVTNFTIHDNIISGFLNWACPSASNYCQNPAVYTQWGANTTYNLGAYIHYGYSYYRSLQGNNLGRTPGAVGSSAWWAIYPVDYSADATYFKGDFAYYRNGEASNYYRSKVSGNQGHQPDISPTYWELYPDNYHLDGIITWGSTGAAGAAVYAPQIYNNTFIGPMKGNITGPIFCTVGDPVYGSPGGNGISSSCIVFNNVLVTPTAWAMIFGTDTAKNKFYNNTVIANSGNDPNYNPSTSACITSATAGVAASGTGDDIRNNICIDYGAALHTGAVNPSDTINFMDYNAWFNPGTLYHHIYENGPYNWCAATTYQAYTSYGYIVDACSGSSDGLGAFVNYNGVLYKSLQANNIGHQPDISPAWWSSYPAQYTLAGWQTVGFDTHSITTDPKLTSSYIPAADSPVIHAGANLTSLCGDIPALCKDKAGNPRPVSGPWDIGAFQSVSGIPPPPDTTPPSAPTGVSVN